MVAISIVSPSFNQKPFVQQTLDSIASQDFPDYELIVFDGGSTDGTLDILKRAAAADKRMSLHVGRDSGQANAINLGFREAKGDIVTWINTDDSYVSPTVLSEIADLFGRRPDVDVLYGRGKFVAPDGTVLRDTYINDEADLLRYRFINSNGILQPAVFFRRRVLERFGYLDESMGCAFDYEYWVRLIAGGAKFAFHDKVLVHAIWHDQMKTSKSRGQSFEESIEVCRRHYGFSPMEWIERLSGFLVAGSDFVITDKGRDNPKIRKETKQHALEAFRQRNVGAATSTAILSWAHAAEASKTLAAFRESSGIGWDRVVVTTFNEPYFEQGLTLIASLHRTATRRTPILVYDLGLSNWQRGHIATLRDVYVVDYPKDMAPDYPEFFDPKSYVYKILAVNHAASIAGPRGMVLFIDAGVAVVEGVDGIFGRVQSDGVFFVDHDDKPVSTLHNMTFAPDSCIDGMNATNGELAATHLCSCLFGYRIDGKFQALFSDALTYAADPRVAVGDKHPPLEAQIMPALGAAADRERRRAANNRAFQSRLDRDEMRRLFGYQGHRQDQTILSILAARYRAPLSSARAWCISNDASSDASMLNWATRGSLTVKSSLAAGKTFQRSVTIHHRGLYLNLEQLDYNIAHDRRAIVLGNGPSLKGFDFNRLKPFDVFGMNAAYRYWDEIGWYPKFYSCLDLVVGMSHAEEIARLVRKAPEYGIERFLLRRNLISHIGPIENSDRIVEFDLLRNGTRQFARLPITTGSHTLIWAAALGYRDIYLMGVDCNYVEIVPGAERREGTGLEITAAAGENPNYFFAGYQQVGDKYNVPNSSPDLHLGSWRAAAGALRDVGAKALNANPESKVDAFDFCLFEDVEKAGRVPVIPRRKILGASAFDAESGLKRLPSALQVLLKFAASKSAAPIRVVRDHINARKVAALEPRRKKIISELPVKAPIFLPTDRIPLAQQVAGLERVRQIFRTDLDAQYRPRLRALRDRHLGQDRCFIIGNGPSLNRTNLARLKGEVTFATNGFFLKAPELNWLPTYYVVEDHLVAEDRAQWINGFKGPTKLFPANLAYCLDKGDDTIFFDLRPRKSYPHGFDFSTDACNLVYAGGTVTFSCIQLAYYFGFREIYLVGVDADYKLPSDAKVVGKTGVSELDMASDDPNHFHPDYFGKGFRWHDPNVDRMLAAYSEAKKVTEQEGKTQIYNATIGGKLDVFPRVAFSSLFERVDRVSAPRTLLIDVTGIGGTSATGQLKANYFGHFGTEKLLHLFARPRSSPSRPFELGLAPAGMRTLPRLRYFAADSPDVETACRAFNPDIVCYRPVAERRELHAAAMRLIQTLGKPWVIWLMDDWPERLRTSDSQQYAEMDRDLRRLLRGAADRFAISEAMAAAFKERYGVPFKIYRNGALPDDWALLQHHAGPDGRARIRYAGSLAPDTTRDSVLEVATVVSDVASRLPVSLEIHTQAQWYRAENHKYSSLQNVTLDATELDEAAYRQWLVDADILLVAYNFDRETIRYLRYSFGNKTPEYLASGAAVLAYGPRELATIKFLAGIEGAVVVDEPDRDRLGQAIEELVTDAGRRADMGENARMVAFSRLELDTQRQRFITDLRAAANLPDSKSPSTPALETISISRDARAQIDECRLIFEMANRPEAKGVMIDVGAHHGSSLSRFAAAGWRVVAFEPDPANRQELVKQHGGRKNVSIFDEAVSDAAGQNVPFYASDESTGISGLSAFRESHREVARVRTTTLDEIVARHRIASVDFLKIDVEGFEMAVLRGLDFDRLKPAVIMAEFEDSKSGTAGCTSHDIAGLLFDRGYAVYVSEWHPIERYGVSHSFRRLRKYPCDVPSSSWGNLIAFREDPEPDALQRAIRAAVDRPIEFERRDEEDLAEAPQQAAQRRVRAKFADLALPMRRRPFITVFVALVCLAVLVLIAARPYLSAVSTPELLLVLLGANLVLTALVARIIRKSLIARMSDLAQRPEDALNRPEARSHQLIRAQLRGLEDRSMSEMRAKFADLARPMRRRPFISAFVAVVGVAALVLIATRPYLSAIATPELLLVLLGANLVLTALVARIVRKSLISRISDFVQRTEDTLKRAEARNQHLIKFLDPEDRITSEMRMRSETRDPDVGTLADGLAQQTAGASQPGQPSVGQTEETRARSLEHAAGAESLVAEQALAGADIATASAEIGGIGAGPEVNGAANVNTEPTMPQSIAAPTLVATDGDSGPGRGSTHRGGYHADRD